MNVYVLETDGPEQGTTEIVGVFSSMSRAKDAARVEKEIVVWWADENDEHAAAPGAQVTRFAVDEAPPGLDVGRF